jgi:hypothetical protein
MRRFATLPGGKVVLWWLCMVLACAVHARPPGDSVTYDLTVTDEAGRPLEGATIWSIGDSLARTDFRDADLARLVSRYGQDVDFIASGELHPHLEAWRTDLQGRLQVVRDASEVGGMKRVRMHFAAFKRGYITAQLSDEARNNTQRQIRFRLLADAHAKVDERMLELDRLRARARQLADGPVNHGLATALKDIDAQLRVLAADLEKRGLADEAAAAYLALAYLPSVETGRSSEGQPIIVGFINGFNADVPSRVADRQRALQLQRAHPMLAYQVMWSGYVRRGLDPLAPGVAPLRTAYVNETREMLARHGDRLWPLTRYSLWQALIREQEFAAACDALRAFHRSEPSLYHRERWLRLSSQYRDQVRSAGGPADARCELPLPKR